MFLRPILIFVISLAALFATPANAFFDQKLGMMEGSNALLVYATLGTLGVFIVLTIMFWVKQRQANKQVTMLQKVADHHHDALDSQNTGIIHVNHQGNIIYANKVACYLLGHKAGSLSFQALMDILPVDAESNIEAAYQTARESTFEIDLDGHDKRARVRMAPVSVANPDIAFMVAIDDVTRYQQSLTANQHMQAHLSDLLSQSSRGVITVDLDQKHLTLNQLAADWLKLAADDNLHFDALVQTIDVSNQNAFTVLFEKLAKGEQAELSCFLTTSDQPIPVNVVAVPADHTQDKNSKGLAHILIEDLRKVKSLQRQLDEHRGHLSAMMNTGSKPMYLSDENNRLVSANSAFCRYFGVSMTRVKGMPLNELVCFNEALRTLHQFGDSGSTMSKVVPFQKQDGSTASLNVSLTVYRLNGSRAGLAGMIEDISAETQLRQALDKAKRDHQQVMELSPFGLAVVDNNDNFIYANQAMSKLLGHAVQALKSKSLFELFADPDASGKAAKMLHQQGALLHFETVLKGAQGHRKPCKLSVVPIHSESEEAHMIWIQDAADEVFQQRCFEQIMASSQMPMAVLEQQGFSYTNAAACAFLGAKHADDLLGALPHDEQFNTDFEAASELANFVDVARSTMTRQTFNWQHQVGHNVLPCEITLAPVAYEDRVTVLCLWVDLRKLEEANAARLEAVNLRQAAEREVEEKQALLASSQDQLATKAKSLEQTQSKLNQAELELTEKVAELSELQQAHQDISEHLSSLQGEYSENKRLLSESEQVNKALEHQLNEAGDKVGRLQTQRNQIADALQYSERQYKKAQSELVESEQQRQRLLIAKDEQANKSNQLESEILQLKGSLANKDKQLADVGGKITSLQSQLISAGETSDHLRQQLVNQKKASEQAEMQRRQLHDACQKAQSELASRSRRIDHLQDEMQKLEELAQQEKGDMQAHAEKLAQELSSKQAELTDTRSKLNHSVALAEAQKQESENRKNLLDQIQAELNQMEMDAERQQADAIEAAAQWLERQASLEEALQSKQQQLQQTEQALSAAHQQSEEEVQAQQQRVSQLKDELTSMKDKVADTAAKADQQAVERQNEQRQLAEALKQKHSQLQTTQQQLQAHVEQVAQERLAREAQTHRLEELERELNDVEARAIKQKEMLEGSDEQWRQHHAEIESQRQKLQSALVEAEKQNAELSSSLDNRLSALDVAEEKAKSAQREERRLNDELSDAKAQSQQLEAKLKEQALRETKLQQQVASQQSALQQSESNVSSLKAASERLQAQLADVQRQYQSTQQSLENQDKSQHSLTAQLSTLESELAENKEQLSAREAALVEAQEALATSAAKLAEQEAALVEAQKAELAQAREQAKLEKEQALAAQQLAVEQAENVVEINPDNGPQPEYAQFDMPENPSIWFDLLPYLQHSQQVTSLVPSLTELNHKLDSAITEADEATMAGDNRRLMSATKKLIHLIRSIESPPLEDMANRLEADSENGQYDNIAIFWPIAKQNLMKTQRVIYSHLHG